jgi:hypothetical protein
LDGEFCAEDIEYIIDGGNARMIGLIQPRFLDYLERNHRDGLWSDQARRYTDAGEDIINGRFPRERYFDESRRA